MTKKKRDFQKKTWDFLWKLPKSAIFYQSWVCLMSALQDWWWNFLKVPYFTSIILRSHVNRMDGSVCRLSQNKSVRGIFRQRAPGSQNSEICYFTHKIDSLPLQWDSEAAMCPIYMRSKYDWAEMFKIKIFKKYFGMRTSGTSWRKSGIFAKIRKYYPQIAYLGVPDVRITTLIFWQLNKPH